MTNYDVSVMTLAGEIAVIKTHSIDRERAVRDAFNAARRDGLAVVADVDLTDVRKV